VARTTKFNLKFSPGQKIIRENWFSPPEDPLGELSHLEMGLRRFCFERNRKIFIEFGNIRKEIFLDPDIILILNELPVKYYQLLKGKKIELSFPESKIVIYLEPIDIWIIDCTWQEFGTAHIQKHFILQKSQVLAVIQSFLDKIINEAVDKGYIKEADEKEFYEVNL
jgi:hypothetical protein